MSRELIEQVLAGNIEAYGEVVRRYRGMVMTFAAFRLPDRDLAEEVAHQTFVRAYEQLREFDLSADLGAWLRAICRYVAMAERKRALNEMRNRSSYRDRIRSRLFERAEALSQGPDRPEADRVAALRKCAERLPEESRKVLRLRYGLDMRLAEVGAKLGRSATWVSTSLMRIREALRRCVEDGLAAGTD